METAIQKIAIGCFLIIGLSHALQPKAWVKFFVFLRSKGEPGAFIVGLLSLMLGLLIVGFHNVWTGIPTVLTVVGWAQVVKGTRYFLFPQAGLRTLAWVTEERAWVFVVGGWILTSLALLFAYGLWRS